MGKKRVVFSVVVNIVFLILTLYYIPLAAYYFIHEIVLLFGNEYEKAQFVFELIGLPIVIIGLGVYFFKIAALILDFIALKKIKNGTPKIGLHIIAGLIQLADAFISPLGTNAIVLLAVSGTYSEVLNYLIPDYFHSFITSSLMLFFNLFVLAKSLVLIVSSILLFTTVKIKAKNVEEEKSNE